MQRTLLCLGFAVLTVPVFYVTVSSLKPSTRVALLIALGRAMESFTLLPWYDPRPPIEGILIDDDEFDDGDWEYE